MPPYLRCLLCAALCLIASSTPTPPPLHNDQLAQNVILFIGDGMDINTQAAARLYADQTSPSGATNHHDHPSRLAWDTYAHVGLLKTYCSDRMTCDSGATANALFSGVKSRSDAIGVDASLSGAADCGGSLRPAARLRSVVAQAQAAGMRTGFVTNTRVMHATPAALYAHAPSRQWECDANVPAAAQAAGCTDIARQLIEGDVGRRLNVIMGGGRQLLVGNLTATERDPLDGWACRRRDGRDLMEEWRRQKEAGGERWAVAETAGQLADAGREAPDYLLGIFANAHMSYEFERERGEAGQPSLAEMTLAALAVLERGRHGWLLVVEGGMIDMAHHRGWARIALDETLAFSAAVEAAERVVNGEETLMVVTADHGLTMSINGEGGEDVLGIVQRSVNDGVPYTMLSYATGGPDGFQVDVDEEGGARRRDPSLEDTHAFRYVQQVGIRTDENTHGGGDVTVHARGPRARAFGAVQEQTYVAHAIGWAANLGCERRGERWREDCA